MLYFQTRFSWTRIAVSAGLALLPILALADAPADGSEAVRNALGKQEGDVDQTDLLRDTLTSRDKQYSLQKRGKVTASYNFSYSYIGQQAIDATFNPDTSQLTQFQIENTRSHTFSHSVSVEYGLLDNLTGSAAMSLVSRYSDASTFSGLSHGLGDMNLGLRWQPFELKRDMPSITASGSVSLPTGRSPYRTDITKNLVTGSGTTSFSGGLSISKVIDPVALFGNASLSYSLPVSHLHQVRDSEILTSIKPGVGFGYGAGFAYSMSYDISVTFSLQHSVGWPSTLTFEDGKKMRTNISNSAMMNYGVGVRLSPTMTVNVTVGVGLTPDSPDFTLGIGMPLNF